MMKKLKIIGSITLLLMIIITSCEKSEELIISETRTVTFDINGGTTNISNSEIENNTTVTKPTDPVRSGYNFVEWQLDGNAFDFTTKITSDITLKANWRVNLHRTYAFADPWGSGAYKC